MYKKATWNNGKKTITGKWCYFEDSDEFLIALDIVDSVTGSCKTFSVTGDTPEWGKWKLVREKQNEETNKCKYWQLSGREIQGFSCGAMHQPYCQLGLKCDVETCKHYNDEKKHRKER